MEKHVRPTNINEYIGNVTQVSSFCTWIENIIENPHYKKRICFLTGTISTGKSILVNLLLKKYNYTITSFSSTNLRIQKYRNNLYQAVRFCDVLSMFQKKKSFRKAIIIDDFENMNIATQEIYKTLKKYIIEKKTKGIPIIFIGNTSFTTRRPLGLYSKYIRLKPRNKKETIEIIQHIVSIYKEHNKSIKISKSKSFYTLLYNNSKGDVRKVIAYLDFLIKGTTYIKIEESISQKPIELLYTIINIKTPITLSKIIDIVSTDMSILYGIHELYIDYFSYYLKKYTTYNYTNNYYFLLSTYSEYISKYQILTSHYKEYYTNECIDISIILLCYSLRVLLHNIQNIGDKTKLPYKAKNTWWVSIEKHIDTSIKTSLYSKFHRSLLYKNTIYNKGYKMIEKNIGNPIIWRPSNVHYSNELIELYKN